MNAHDHARALEPHDSAAWSVRRTLQTETSSHARHDDRSRRIAHARKSQNEGSQDRRRIELSEENTIRHLVIHIRWIQHPKNDVARPTTTLPRSTSMLGN
jgi:hypothetical protein